MVLLGSGGGRGWCRLLDGICEHLDRGGIVFLKIFKTLLHGSHHRGDVEGVE